MAKKAAEKTLKITQVKSAIGFPADQKRTVRALGLKRISHTVEQADIARDPRDGLQGQAPRQGRGALATQNVLHEARPCAGPRASDTMPD